MRLEHILFWIILTRAIVANKVITNYTTDKPILHVEALFISVERGLRWEILSRNSLKYYIHFSFILKLIIFIYKQLKRPAFFTACTNGLHGWFLNINKWPDGKLRVWPDPFCCQAVSSEQLICGALVVVPLQRLDQWNASTWSVKVALIINAQTNFFS